MKTGNIGIRNLADIGVGDIDVYGTDKRKKYGDIVYPNVFVLFFRSINQSKGALPKIENQIIKYDEQYDGGFGFDTFVPKLYPSREIKRTYLINNDIKTKIKSKSLDRNEFKLKEPGEENYYVSSACILRDKEIKLQVKGFMEKLKDSYNISNLLFKFVNLNDQKMPIKNNLSKFESYDEENLKITLGQEIALSSKESFNAEITIKAMKEYDDHIGLICYYNDAEEKEVIVGQCNFSPNRKIEIPLKFLKVKVFSNGTQKYSESHPFDTKTLSDFLNKKTMGQAGINVKIPSSTVEILKLYEIYKELDEDTNQQVVKFDLNNFVQEVDLKGKDSLSTIFKRDKILATKDDNSEEKLDDQIYKVHQINVEIKLKNSNEMTTLYDKYKMNFKDYTKDEIIYELKRIYFETFVPIYLLEDITFKIYQENVKWMWTEAFERNNRNPQKLKILLSKFSLIHGTESYSTYAHELAHGLGIDHIFGLDKDHPIQPLGITLENVMDYYTSVNDEVEKKVFIPKPYIFIREQWDIMRAFYKTRTEKEESRYYEFIGAGNIRDEFKRECENLFSSL